MKKFIITIICLAFIFTLSIVVKNTNTKKDNKLAKVKVAEVTHSIFYTPMYLADKLGYFKENGLDVEIILTSGADKVAAAVMSKDVQIGFCGSEQTVYIYNRGAKDYLVNFAGLTKRDGSFIVSRSKDDSFDINNLKNKTILGGRNGGMPAMTLNYTLNQNNINATVDTSVDFANLTGAFILNRELVKYWLQNKIKGKIVNVTSQAAFHGSTSGHAHYAASKAGLVTFSISLAREVAPEGINVNLVAPGIMRSPMTEEVLKDPNRKDAYLERIPVRRIAETDDVAKAVVFLLSTQADYMTGTTLDLTGGMLMR